MLRLKYASIWKKNQLILQQQLQQLKLRQRQQLTNSFLINYSFDLVKAVIKSTINF
jgi:hypothetical protein